MKTVIYVHGRGGSADEAEHYRPLFPDCTVSGIDYKSFTPWETGREIHEAVSDLRTGCDEMILVANSIGAFFSMNADIEELISHAFFISPVVDMEKLITGMMSSAGVTEQELREKVVIHTDTGEDLSWEYLCYVRDHPVRWNVPTEILYGSRDMLTSIGTITDFARSRHAHITVMNGGEHWFHTEDQMRFLDSWIRDRADS